MPRVHLLSIYERFLDKKAIITASKHRTMTFFSRNNHFLGKLEKKIDQQSMRKY